MPAAPAGEAGSTRESVVARGPDLTPGGTEDPENGANDHQHASDRVEDPDVDQQGQQHDDYSADDHAGSFRRY